VSDLLQLETNKNVFGAPYCIIDVIGRVIYSGIITSEYMQIDVSQFRSGIYLLNINDEQTYIKIMKY
jgi:hypothetical protein